jgi:hypothetical protein
MALSGTAVCFADRGTAPISAVVARATDDVCPSFPSPSIRRSTVILVPADVCRLCLVAPVVLGLESSHRYPTGHVDLHRRGAGVMKAVPVVLSLALTAVVSVIAVLVFGLVRPADDRQCLLPLTAATRVTTSVGWKLVGTSIERMTVRSTQTVPQTVRASGRTGSGGTGACVAPAARGAHR